MNAKVFIINITVLNQIFCKIGPFINLSTPPQR